MKKIIHISLVGLLAFVVVGTPVVMRAQSTNAPAKKITTEKKTTKKSLPFHGNIKAIDKTAKTISVGTEVIQITSETVITKAGKPATLSDGADGDQVSGAYRKDAEGKLNALSVRFGPKPAAEPSNTKTNKVS